MRINGFIGLFLLAIIILPATLMKTINPVEERFRHLEWIIGEVYANLEEINYTPIPNYDRREEITVQAYKISEVGRRGERESVIQEYLFISFEKAPRPIDGAEKLKGRFPEFKEWRKEGSKIFIANSTDVKGIMEYSKGEITIEKYRDIFSGFCKLFVSHLEKDLMIEIVRVESIFPFTKDVTEFLYTSGLIEVNRINKNKIEELYIDKTLEILLLCSILAPEICLGHISNVEELKYLLLLLPSDIFEELKSPTTKESLLKIFTRLQAINYEKDSLDLVKVTYSENRADIYKAEKIDRTRAKEIVAVLKKDDRHEYYKQIIKNINWSFKRSSKVDALNVEDVTVEEESDDDDEEDNWPKYICIAIIVVLILLIIMVTVMIVRKRNSIAMARESLLLSNESSRE